MENVKDACDIPDTVWIFGYGSLLWKPGFPYQDKVIGYVEGYKRRFWQASTNHRGTKEKVKKYAKLTPGRVATLVEDIKERTWGIAYHVKPKDVLEVMLYLENRETGGYQTKEVLFCPKDNKEPYTVLLYIATPCSENYVGKQPLDTIAHFVVQSNGCSGDNTEYVLLLAKKMREIAPSVHDKHLYGLEARVRALMDQNQQTA